MTWASACSMPCRHGETGIRNRLKIGLFGLRVRFPLAAPNDVVKYCWIARTKQSVITLAALITPSSRLERKKYDVERYQASNRTARYGNSADALPSDYRRRSFGCGRTGLFSAVFLVVEGVVDVKLGNRKTTAIIMLVVEVTAAIIGLIIMILMFRALYAA